MGDLVKIPQKPLLTGYFALFFDNCNQLNVESSETYSTNNLLSKVMVFIP